MKPSNKSSENRRKKPYSKPRLVVYGTLRESTKTEIKVPGAPEGGLGSLPS